MSYTYLPLQPTNDFTRYHKDNTYRYLVIGKVEKPTRRTKKNEENFNTWEKQQETLKRLETGHFNCYNNPMEPCNIVKDLWWIVDNFNDCVFYKINPTSAKRQSSGYCSPEKWKFYEFDVIKKFKTIEELYQSFCDDFIFFEVISEFINNCIGNDEVKKWNNIWSTIQHAIPDIKEHIYFSDMTNSLNNNSCYKYSEVRDNALYELMTSGSITITSKYDASYSNMLSRTFQACTYKSMWYYTKCKLEDVEKIELSEKDIKLLQENADKLYVEELIKILNPKFPGMKLVVKKTEYYDDGYCSRESTEEIDVKDANDAKMYIARNFDVTFTDLQGNIDEINIGNEDFSYEFKLM